MMVMIVIIIEYLNVLVCKTKGVAKTLLFYLEN